MGEMALAAKGKGLTAATQARKHPGVLVGVGLVALAGCGALVRPRPDRRRGGRGEASRGARR